MAIEFAETVLDISVERNAAANILRSTILLEATN